MRDERRETRDEREERIGKGGMLRRENPIAAISMRCRPNFGLTQVEPELGHYLA